MVDFGTPTWASTSMCEGWAIFFVTLDWTYPYLDISLYFFQAKWSNPLSPKNKGKRAASLWIGLSFYLIYLSICIFTFTWLKSVRIRDARKWNPAYPGYCIYPMDLTSMDPLLIVTVPIQLLIKDEFSPLPAVAAKLHGNISHNFSGHRNIFDNYYFHLV